MTTEQNHNPSDNEPEDFRVPDNAAAAVDFDDPRAFRIPPGSEDLAIKQRSTHVPVRKVSEARWFRATNDEAYDESYFVVITDKDTLDETEWIVAPDLVPELAGDVKTRRLVACVAKTGETFLLRITPPNSSGSSNTWLDSALEVLESARSEWTRGQSDTNVRAYNILTAPGVEPKLPTKPMWELVKLAYKGRFISDRDHEVLQRLRGEL